jgi:hypothetical protein
MYDIGGGLEVVSPLCPQHFLPVAGVANLAKVCFSRCFTSMLLFFSCFWCRSFFTLACSCLSFTKNAATDLLKQLQGVLRLYTKQSKVDMNVN